MHYLIRREILFHVGPFSSNRQSNQWHRLWNTLHGKSWPLHFLSQTSQVTSVAAFATKTSAATSGTFFAKHASTSTSAPDAGKPTSTTMIRSAWVKKWKVPTICDNSYFDWSKVVTIVGFKLQQLEWLLLSFILKMYPVFNSQFILGHTPDYSAQAFFNI